MKEGTETKESIQPFGYTGYQYDKTAGTYYAQAREYKAELGRFAAVDTIKGFAAAPYTLDEYGYCWNNPKKYVDLNGREPGEWTSGEDTDYVGVYYLNAEDGAYIFGHAALLFYREDGSGTFYSFAAPRMIGKILYWVMMFRDICLGRI